MTNSRRKNKHPKRAENVKTVVVVRKGDDREEEEGEEEREEDDAERLLRMLMCVPCDDGVEPVSYTHLTLPTILLV